MSAFTPENSPAANAPLSVSTLNRRVRECLENSFPLCWVSGEISNLTYAASGHVYFALKDAQAQVRCVMWRSRAQTLGWRLENGQKIEARALVAFYEPRGEFQLNIEAVRRAGQGDLFERFLRLKAQLESEGLFAVDRKRLLPSHPRHIAIVTSRQAAALRDVLTTLHRRAPQLRITLVPTLVQGEGAGPRIAEALAVAADSGADLVILCRGGGSLEDLWAFNEEIVARAIAASAVPVITGIGHETDFTIADFAADLRAPTPTAAAELACPERASLRQRLQQLSDRLTRITRRQLGDQQQQLDWLKTRVVHPAERIAQQRQALAGLATRLRLANRRQIDLTILQLSTLGKRFANQRPDTAARRLHLEHLALRQTQQIRWQFKQQRTRIDALSRSLHQLDPHSVLARGYSLTLSANGHIVREASQLAPGEKLTLRFALGEAQATVDQVVAAPEAD